MSVRFTAADNTDTLRVTSAMAVGSGNFSFGVWVYFVSTPAALGDIMNCANAFDSGLGTYIGIYQDNSPIDIIGLQSGSAQLGTFTPTTATWYYVVYSRSGTTLRVRVFDDTSSTTPQSDETVTDSTDYGTVTLDSFAFGALWANECPDAEVESGKVHLGVAWTDAQCRTESQNYALQTGGGTEWGTWELQNVDADANGINDISGNARNLTNTGSVAGANGPPSQIGAGGGGLFINIAGPGGVAGSDGIAGQRGGIAG